MTRSTATAPLLDIRGLRIQGRDDSGWHDIVHGVDLTLAPGEVLGLIGESGAGKSTIGLASMGYARPGCRFSAGSVTFDGTDLLRLGPAERRRCRGARIAYVAQSAAASFNPGHRIIDQVTETAVQRGLMTRAAARSKALELFTELQLPDPEALARRYPHQVSGGQLQRAMTAMALLCGPDLVIFDEPTTALDVTTQVEVLAAMRKALAAHGTAAIYITHDLAVVAQMADRIMVLRHGATVEEAPTRKMLEAPEQDYTRSLWAVRNLARPERGRGDALLRVEGVTARYGRRGPTVLHDIGLAVPRGRTLAVVGESGSGKSTLGRVIAGLLPPVSGALRFDGTPLAPALKGRSRADLQRIQMIYQSADTALNPRQTVGELIGRRLTLYAGLRGAERRARVVELLELIELDESHIDRLPGELSGGQKQRVSIARALAADPELIICDEVTSALDQVVQHEILKLLRQVQDRTGVSYLFITHDIATVRAIADEVVVMHRGRIVEQGPKSQVLTPPHAPYTERLLSSVPETDPDWLDTLLARRPARA